MNKFLKGAVACAAIVPCLTGLTGCFEDNEKGVTGEQAYNTVFDRVGDMATYIVDMSVPGKEFQLNINMSLDVETIMQGVTSTEGKFGINLRAVIGARNNNKKELFGNIGIVDGQNTFRSILSAYAASDIDANAEVDEDIRYTNVTNEVALDIAVEPDNWSYYEGILYTYDQDTDSHVLVEGEYDSTATYYMMTQDLLHLYLASNPSVLKEYTLLTEQPEDWADNYTSYYVKGDSFTKKLSTDVYEAGRYYILPSGGNPTLVEDETEPADWATGDYYTRSDAYFQVTGETAPTWEEDTYYEQTGIDINELIYEMTGEAIGFPEGKMYLTLNLGDTLPEYPEDEPITPEDEAMPSIDDIFEMIEDVKDMTYNEFLEEMGVTGNDVTVTGEKASNGDVSLKMTGEGRTMIFTAKTDGGVVVSMEMEMPIDQGVSQAISLTIEIDLEEEVDEQYLPEELDSYGESAGSLEDVIAGLLGGTEE